MSPVAHIQHKPVVNIVLIHFQLEYVGSLGNLLHESVELVTGR